MFYNLQKKEAIEAYFELSVTFSKQTPKMM